MNKILTLLHIVALFFIANFLFEIYKALVVINSILQKF